MKEHNRNKQNSIKNIKQILNKAKESKKSNKQSHYSTSCQKNIPLNHKKTLVGQDNPNIQMTVQRFIPSYDISLISIKRTRQRPLNKTWKNEIPGKITEENWNNPISKKNFQQKSSFTKMVKLKKSLHLFHQKATLNSIHRKPVDFDFLQIKNSKQVQNQILNFNRITLPKIFLNIIYIIKLIYIILYFIAYPLSLLFELVSQSQILLIVKLIGLILCSLDIIEALKITTGNHYAQSYLIDEMKQQLSRQKATIALQIAIILMTISSIVLTQHHSFNNALFLVMSLNINRYFKYQYILEEQFFTATHYQKYWDLIKVLAMNLLICHFLACILISITFINPQQNWMNNMNISSSPWYEQYIWSYYFGTTILLTIGFGDFHAVNYIQGFFIIFISFFACVFFGYNINYIGNLIKSIRQDEQQKYNKLKIFGSLAERTKVTEELRTEIANYIIQQSKLNQISNHSHEKKLLFQLPNSLRSEFLKEANKRLFNHFLRLIHLSQKTIEKLSENIQAKIFIPDEVIKKSRSAPNFMILQSGEVGYVAKIKGKNHLNNTIIQKLQTNIQKEPKLICLDVLLSQPLNYQIKSLAYSVIYQMNKQKFENSLQNSQEDYQNYRQILDKCRYKFGEFGIIQCRFCQNKFHTLFQCPKLHYVPFRNIVSLKKHKSKYVQKQIRTNFTRIKKFAYPQHSSQSIASDPSHQNIQKKKHNRHYSSFYQMNDISINNKSYFDNYSSNSKSNSNYFLTMQIVTQIREDINSLKKQTEKSSFKFDLWGNLDCDQLHNYTYYLSKQNSNQVIEKWNLNYSFFMQKSSRKKTHRKTTEYHHINN